MTARALIWLGALIIFSSVLSLASAEKAKILRESHKEQEAFQRAQIDGMKSYLQKQKDARKLISLAKRLPSENAELIKLIILKAYELEPNRRDIAILASYYQAEAKNRVKKIDPLYSK
jgi:hypothetical protein